MSEMFIKRNRSPNSLVAMLGIVALSAGCGSREDGPARQTEQYQVIDEGSVSGVTSTIHAPGDLIPVKAPTPEPTGTNIDTTTAFSILDSLITTAPPAEVDPAFPAPPSVPPAAAPRVTPSSPRPPATPRPAPNPTPRPTRPPTPLETPDPAPTPIEDEEPTPPPAEEPDVPEEATPTPPGIDPENDEPPMVLRD